MKVLLFILFGFLSVSAQLVLSRPTCEIKKSGLSMEFDASQSDYSGTWTDLTGNGNNLTINGSIVDDGIYFNLDGSDDYFRLASNGYLNDATFTYCVYVRPHEGAIHSGIKYKDGIGNGDWWISSGGSTWHGGAAGGLGNVDGGSYINGQWSYVCITYTSTFFELFVDGVSVATDNTVGATSKTGDPFDLGGYLTGRYDIDIARVHMYDSVLNDEEILQNYKCVTGDF